MPRKLVMGGGNRVRMGHESTEVKELFWGDGLPGEADYGVPTNVKRYSVGGCGVIRWMGMSG